MGLGGLGLKEVVLRMVMEMGMVSSFERFLVFDTVLERVDEIGFDLGYRPDSPARSARRLSSVARTNSIPRPGRYVSR